MIYSAIFSQMHFAAPVPGGIIAGAFKDMDFRERNMGEKGLKAADLVKTHFAQKDQTCMQMWR